jgi:hypothetical protein
LKDYITFREEDKKGILQYYILQRKEPHYVGKIVGETNELSLLKVPIAGYRLYVSFSGVLIGNYLPSYKGVEDDVLVEFQKMSAWYLDNRIAKDEKRYKKFKL